MPVREKTGETTIRGIPVSAGVCVGKVILLGRQSVEVVREEVAEAQVPAELERLERALVTTREQLHEIQERVVAGLGSKDARILEAHIMVLDDPMLIDEVTRLIREERVTALFAFHTVVERFIRAIEAMSDEYLRDRVADLRDVAGRVVNNFLGRQDTENLDQIRERCIIIAHDLAPSVTAGINKALVLGFGTDVGGKTSHTAIMARSLAIPAVVGLQDASRRLQTGQMILLDGYNGLVVLNPSDQTLFEYGQIEQRQRGVEEKLREVHGLPAVTLDGAQIILSANVENAAGAKAAREAGAEGVGLFRTEFLFINRETLPDEQEQFETYRAVAAELKPAPVIIRTLDLGGDKLPATSSLGELGTESNPFLGCRAIRFCLQETAIFRAQLRAILRASVDGNVKIMYPMVSGLEELTQSNTLLEQCKAELRAEGQPFDENLESGAMIEIPSAALVADSMARRVKFFSLGTNDLIQYTLAADRLNERVAYLYDPTHPAVLRLIQMTVEAAHRHGIWVGVCGEMASDPVLVPLLLGLGVDELSATPPVVPALKYLVRRLKLSEARELATFALGCESSAEILARSRQIARRAAPELFPNVD